MTNDNAVQSILEQRKATDQLRIRDCEMLSTLKDHLGENIRLHGILNQIKAKIADLQRKMRTPKPCISAGLLTLGIVFFVIGLIGLFVSLEMGEGVIIPVVAILGGIAFIVPAIIKLVKEIEKWEAFLAATKAQLEVEQKNAKVAQDNINNYWEGTVQVYLDEIVPERFPQAYATNYTAVSNMLYLMSNMRADTIKEAINLYEEICYHNQIRAAINEMASSAVRSAMAAERTASATQATAASAAATAASAASTAASMASINSTLARGVHVEHSGSVNHHFN